MRVAERVDRPPPTNAGIKSYHIAELKGRVLNMGPDGPELGL
jgi:hypothetical protein